MDDANLRWELPGLEFGYSGQIRLSTITPAAAVGATYPVTITIASAGPEALFENNTGRYDVTVMGQMFLPTVSR